MKVTEMLLATYAPASTTVAGWKSKQSLCSEHLWIKERSCRRQHEPRWEICPSHTYTSCQHWPPPPVYYYANTSVVSDSRSSAVHSNGRNQKEESCPFTTWKSLVLAAAPKQVTFEEVKQALKDPRSIHGRNGKKLTKYSPQWNEP